MQRGPKPKSDDEKAAAGTLQPCRETGQTLVLADDPPSKPEWLTPEGNEVWLDDLGRVLQNRMVDEVDSSMFATYCNLQGAIIKCWRAGEVPPASHLVECRKMAEQFGIFGVRSRMKQAPSPDKPGNPFASRGRRK